jgi:hypothetical protein
MWKEDLNALRTLEHPGLAARLGEIASIGHLGATVRKRGRRDQLEV